jgi:hypothetical protein
MGNESEKRINKRGTKSPLSLEDEGIRSLCMSETKESGREGEHQ